METLKMKKKIEENTVEVNTDLIKIEGCLPYLGCTIVLSGKDMEELKKVKHALKKMLRFSRQLFLENEYLNFLGLSNIKSEDAKEKDNDESPFLHSKHMERQFLIFKEVSYSKRGKGADNMIEDDEEGDEKMESDFDKMAK